MAVLRAIFLKLTIKVIRASAVGTGQAEGSQLFQVLPKVTPEMGHLISNGAVGALECIGLEQALSLSGKVPKIDSGLISRIVLKISTNCFVKSLQVILCWRDVRWAKWATLL